MLTFSKRHKTRLRDFQIVIPEHVRHRIIATMKKHDHKYKQYEYIEEIGEISSGYVEISVFQDELPKVIESEIGKPCKTPLSEEELMNFEPHYLLDVCELFFSILKPYAKDTDFLGKEEKPYYEYSEGFQSSMNRLFSEEGLPFVMKNGRALSTDIAFIGSEIVAKADELLEQHGIKGALEELGKACEDFANNRFKETILKANHALESVRKAILGVEKMKPGEQCRKVIEEVVPEYFEGFRALFKKVMEATDALRHEAPSAGHGQGQELRQVSQQLAELALHLNSTLIIYLLKEWKSEKAGADEQNGQKKDEEVPF